MAERPRRASSELGSEPSATAPAKSSRDTGESEESGESSTEPGPREGSETTTDQPTPEEEESGASKRPHGGDERTSPSPKRVRTSSPGESPGPSTSRLTGRSTAATTSTTTETMDVAAAGDLTIQASLSRAQHAQYQELSKIGDGAYGTVYKARDLTSGLVVALKKVRVPITGDGLPPSTLREIAALKQLDRYEHPHIVRLLDVCQGPYLTLPPGDERSQVSSRGLMLWLVFEHVDRDLASFIVSREGRPIPAETIRQMSREILLGVDFLHSHRIVHRDLKPQNLLVTSQGRIKIADFGLAKTYDFEMRLTTVVVTLWYRSPEVLLGCAYATPVDVWSVGCILAELCRLQALFPGTSEGDQLDRIFQVIGKPSQQEWPENVSLGWMAFPHRQPTLLRSIIPDLPDSGLDLIQRILTFDQHSRLSAAQALAHRYFTEESS